MIFLEQTIKEFSVCVYVGGVRQRAKLKAKLKAALSHRAGPGTESHPSGCRWRSFPRRCPRWSCTWCRHRPGPWPEPSQPVCWDPRPLTQTSDIWEKSQLASALVIDWRRPDHLHPYTHYFLEVIKAIFWFSGGQRSWVQNVGLDGPNVWVSVSFV